jgi:hypothetical protein
VPYDPPPPAVVHAAVIEPTGSLTSSNLRRRLQLHILQGGACSWPVGLAAHTVDLPQCLE